MKDSNPPPPYCSGDQRETENIVSTAFGANPPEEAEELDLFSSFCTVQGIGIDMHPSTKALYQDPSMCSWCCVQCKL